MATEAAGVSPGGGLVVFSVLLLGLGFLIGGAADAKAAGAASRVFLQCYLARPSSCKLVAGTDIGARLANRFGDKTLRRLVIGFIVLMAATMAQEALR